MGAVRPKKHLGQHFLHDQHIAQRIVEALQASGYDKILEIYPLDVIQAEEPYWIDIDGKKEYTDLNMLRQFMKWYLQEKELDEKG